MIFIANADGSIKAVLPSTVNQGSNQANEIVLIAPIIQSAVVDVRFTLPSGAYTEPFVMARYDVASTEFSEKYNAWHCLLDEIVTGLSGEVSVQFTITIGNTIIATTTQTFEVYAGVGYIEPEISYNHYEELKGLISSLGVDVEDIDTGLENLSKEVEDIKKGKQTAIAFNSYVEMIENLNNAPNTEYYVSKNIMIKTLDVPDLWVYSVESTSEPYSYSSDNEIVNELNEVGIIRVGYYNLAQLEAKTTSLNLENGEGVGSIKAIYDTENGPVGSSGNTSANYKPKAEGKNAVALTARAYANGDCSIAGGWSAEAHTKGDVALSAGQAGMTETEFKKEYPNGYPYNAKMLTYDEFKILIQNAAFAACNGKALGIKSSAIGDGTIAYDGQAVTGKFNKESGSETYEDGETLDVRDAIAIIGNGLGSSKNNRSNAIEVYRNHIKSKLAPKHYDDIVRLKELNRVAKSRVVGSFGTKKVDENENVIYDNTHTQIIRSNVSVLHEIDENESTILDENGKPIGGSIYADEQIHSPKVIADYINAGNITVGTETNSGRINLIGPTANIFINGKPITSGSDENKGTKIYKHIITGKIYTRPEDGNTYDIYVEFYSFNDNTNNASMFYEPEEYTAVAILINPEGIIAPPYGTITFVSPFSDTIKFELDKSFGELKYSGSISNFSDWGGICTGYNFEEEVVGV